LGLARATAERIYSIRKAGPFESKMMQFERTARLSEFLGEMSFGGYRELGFDKVLLVEGSTDVTTFQQLLRMYRMDHEVVLLPLGGSALINGSQDTERQLQELTRISPNISVLIDSERAREGESLPSSREAFREVCEKAKVRCHVLKWRAIENYWSERAIQKVKGDKYRALGPYQDRGAINPTWGKYENWRIAQEMTKEELDQTDLGQFMDSLKETATKEPE
jgi:hypothetical protein